MDENYLYQYDPVQSNNQCNGGIAVNPGQNIPSVKFRPIISRLDFFFWGGIKTAFSSLNTLQKVKFSTRSVSHICWCIWRTLWRKILREVPKGVLILHVNVPALRALAIQKKLAYLGFQYLDHPQYSTDLAPSDYHVFPGLKKQLNVSHISSDVQYVAAAATWLDGQISDFFEWLAKVRAKG